MDAARIAKWASKSVVRKYAFELPGVPAEASYLKVVYPFTGASRARARPCASTRARLPARPAFAIALAPVLAPAFSRGLVLQL